MKKKLGNILVFILVIGLSIGYGIYKDDKSKVTINDIYTTEFQEQALSNLENEKGNGKKLHTSEYIYEIQSFFNQYTIDVCLF